MRTISRPATAAICFITALATCGSAMARPTDAPWSGASSVTDGPDIIVSIDADGSSSPAILSYDNHASEIDRHLYRDGGGHNNGNNGEGTGHFFESAAGRVVFSTMASRSGPLPVSYSFLADHGEEGGATALTAFAEGPHGIHSESLFVEALNGAVTAEGFVTLPVTAGYIYGFQIDTSSATTPAVLAGSLTVDSGPGQGAIIHAVPNGGQTIITSLFFGTPGETQSIRVLTSDGCNDGVLDDPVTVFGTYPVTYDESGVAYYSDVVDGDGPAQTFVAGQAESSSGVLGEISPCVHVGPDNDAWTRALIPAFDSTADPSSATVQGFIDLPGQSRWYRFPVTPGQRAVIELSGFSKDYDLHIFKDIAQAFEALVGDADVDGLNRLSAEFSPSVFSPSVFSPSVFSPSVFSPDAFAPSVFSPSVFSPSVFSPSVFSPSVFSPSVFSPSVFSPSVFSPSVFSPSVFSPSVFSPSVFSPSVFSPENYASAQIRSLIAVSANPGLAAERVVVDTWNNTGFYYVRVSGKGGAHDLHNDFTLTMRVEGGLCDGIAPVGGTSPATAGGFETIILRDRSRVDASLLGNADQELQALDERLAQFALRPEVNGVIVDLGSLPQLQALNAQADNATSCPYAANLVAEAGKQIVDNYRLLNPGLKYVVLVGGDSQVKFFRHPDQSLLGPEQDYEPPVSNGTHSQSALRLNYVLSQDDYGATTSLSLGDGDLPIPDLPVGRIGETAADMVALLDTYMANAGGVLPAPAKTLVTAYDFQTDVGLLVQDELMASTMGANNASLIAPADLSPEDPASWTADDLRNVLFQDPADILFLAGHFSAVGALAADYRTGVLATELDASPVDYANALVTSDGCHSAYNIVNEHAVPGITLDTDWVQAFARKGAHVFAGTGYQYGDTEFVEYSERLYLQFFRELRKGAGPVSIGDAMVRAKQQYLATTSDMRGLHRKSVMVAALYGLPMAAIDLPTGRGGAGFAAKAASAPIAPVPVAGAPGAILGLQSAPLTINAAGQLIEKFVALDNLETADVLTASYLEGPDGRVVHPAEPAIPLMATEVGVPGLSLRGVGFRGGAWSDQRVIPLSGGATTELRGVYSPFTSTLPFPMRLSTVNYYPALSDGGGTRLLTTPVQHFVDRVGDVEATRRSYGELHYELFYSSNTQTYGANQPALSAPPSISAVQVQETGSDLEITAAVAGDPAAGIQKVWLTSTDVSGNAGFWSSIDMLQDSNDSTLWQVILPGAAANADAMRFMVSAVNGVGLVTQDDNFGSYYRLSAEAGPVPDVALVAPATANYGDYLAATASVSVGGQPLAGIPVLFSIGGSGRVGISDATGTAQVDLPVTVVPGQYLLAASVVAADGYGPGLDESALTVGKVGSIIELQGAEQQVAVDGIESGVTATLRDINGTPLLQRTVYFTVSGGPEGGFTRAVITDYQGRALLGQLALPRGNYQITARFLGDIPTSAGVQTIEDPVYTPAEASMPLSLISAPGCGSSPFLPLFNVNVTGFCYITSTVNGTVQITEGTLIVGPGVTVGGILGTLIGPAVTQVGAGSVRVRELGTVNGAITEDGPGNVEVGGSVNGNVTESGPGAVTILPAGVLIDSLLSDAGLLLSGSVIESDEGALIILGTVMADATESGGGDLIIQPSGQVEGNASESDAGELKNYGSVGGSMTQD